MSRNEQARMKNLARLCSLLLIATISACGDFTNGTAVLATNLPQLIPYIEQFNALSDEYKIAVRFIDDPTNIAGILSGTRSGTATQPVIQPAAPFEASSAVANAASAAPGTASARSAITGTLEPPDLIAGVGIGSITTIDQFADLSSVIEDIGESIFYKKLLDLGKLDDEQLLLPLSFTLPMIVINTNDTGYIENEATIEIDELRRLSGEIEGEAARMGFSPRWNPGAAYLYTRFFDVDFHETAEALPAWNDVRLREAVAYIHTWSAELNGGAEREEEFARTYLYDPGYRLVADGRIRFATMSFGDYRNVPGEIRERLDFRWLSSSNSVPVDEDIVFVGRIRSAKSRRAANAFLLWLFNIETQKNLLETDRSRRVRGFGFAGGFSSIVAINSEALPRLYSEIAGKIPPPQQIIFPRRLPASWLEIREDVIEPWLIAESRTAIVEEPLADRILEWQRQQPVGR